MQSVDEAGWQGVLGVRAPVSTAQRYVVLLRPPSLAARVRVAGGRATEKEMRAWSASAVAQQEQFLARLAAVGARIAPEYRYTRVLNGFSARLDPTSAALLDRDREVVGVYPVRIAYPAQAAEPESGVLPAAVADLEIAGLDGSGVTVALLDTGVDPSHPYLRRRVLPGVDVIDPGAEGSPSPTRRFREGPNGMRPSSQGSSPGTRSGRAARDRAGRVDPPRARRRVAAERRGRIQRLLAHRSDPRRARGGRRSQRRRRRARRCADCADRHGRAVRGVRGRSARARDRGCSGSRHAHDRPCRERRSSGTRVRKHRGARRRARRGDRRCRRREGRRADGARVRASRPPRPVRGRRPARRGSDGHRDRRRDLRRSPDGRARHHRPLLRAGCELGRGALGASPRAALSDDTVEEATSAGALSVLVDGPLPAGAFSLDVPAGVPVVGLAESIVAEIRAMLASGVR